MERNHLLALMQQESRVPEQAEILPFLQGSLGENEVLTVGARGCRPLIEAGWKYEFAGVIPFGHLGVSSPSGVRVFKWSCEG